MLVAHSGAGTLVPGIVEALRAPVTAVALVDALMPHPGRSWFDDAPAEQVRALAVDGVLPPWHTWFPPGTFAEPVPEVPGWSPDLCCYLQLSDAYTGAAAEAAGLGWRVGRLASDHLAVVTRPGGVVDRLLGLLA